MPRQGTSMSRDQLLLMLDTLVPLRMWELAGRTETVDVDALTEAIASHGDDLEFGGPDEHQTRMALVTALALLALSRPDGVDWAGGHWCRDHDACTAYRRQAESMTS